MFGPLLTPRPALLMQLLSKNKSRREVIFAIWSAAVDKIWTRNHHRAPEIFEFLLWASPIFSLSFLSFHSTMFSPLYLLLPSRQRINHPKKGPFTTPVIVCGRYRFISLSSRPSQLCITKHQQLNNSWWGHPHLIPAGFISRNLKCGLANEP